MMMNSMSGGGSRLLAACLAVAFAIIILLPIHPSPATHAAPPATGSNIIRIEILSSVQIQGLTGQFVLVRANITNLSHNETMAGIAYISIVDVNNSLPIDLEDWSASKGVYVPSIAPVHSVTLDWNVRLVKAGSYTVDVLFNKDSDPSPPVASPRIILEVAPKINLNPSNVLPVAFGVPTFLIIILALINYRRGKKMGLYE